MPTTTPQAWGRGKLLAILAAALGAGLVLLTGLGLFIWQVVAEQPAQRPVTQERAPSPVVLDEATLPQEGPARREQIADAQMLAVDDPRAYREGQVTTTVAEPLGVPSPTRTGPVDVPTGYPQTPEGAVAQLAAIDVAVIQAMSVPATHEIYRSWSTGDADPADWVMTGNVTDFLTAAGQSGQTKEAGLVVTATPAAGQVKGTDGQDWTVACVLLELHARLVEEARVAYGHCEAMTWTGDRWVIDTTRPVSSAPSTWPGTELAAQAGWRPWADNH
ncbi:hypothetical protein BJF81_00295 [Ornithinimicrobium sp. CNJ-824]|uniref:hypothetical protein n=1 Tax=Ornithinimicrobium sp. CNJ-824 TaxID=1904966 RepID=UPI000962B17F|nr:hypothetical protein [Ornithinimicrobium sp. CNJ-824]OLT22343.1 hypothetical protein BJF81_00295 [Ornithinimicrobium sp. CNJ-824]